jgi:hypothetical protein
MAVAARLVSNLLVRAMIALLHLGAERGGAARDDVSECLALLGRQNVSPSIEELLTVLAEDIGDFKPTFHHRRRPSPSDCVISITCKLSKGLTVASSVRLETCKYRAVVSRSAWPSRS